MEHAPLARSIVERIAYVAIATHSPDEGPWNTPVYSAYDDDNLYWTSTPASRHSKNLETDDRAFIVVYDPTVRSGDGVGVFIRATATELTTDTDVVFARRLLRERAQGAGLESDSFYRATPQQVWINDIETDENGEYLRDIRVELPLEILKGLATH